VGVIVNKVGGYSRGVLRGVASFAFARHWTCHMQGVNATSIFRNRQRFDGLIVQTATAKQAAALRATAVPVVNVSSAVELSELPSIVSDDRAVGRMGADYFLRRGYRKYAFFAPDTRHFAKLRHEGFAQRLAESDMKARLIESESALSVSILAGDAPLAVMGCNDRAALTVLDRCRATGVRVPEEVAVLGVDNDDLMQSLAYPPLSSINTARERIGFEAAALLERLIGGARVDPTPRLIPPVGVIPRGSTDALALADPEVAGAIRFIDANVGRRIGVIDVAENVAMSRRQLERRFRAATGVSILDEITRRRVDRARQLLADTELTLDQVATATGFNNSSYLSVIFKTKTGLTPGGFRERFRVEGRSQA